MCSPVSPPVWHRDREYGGLLGNKRHTFSVPSLYANIKATKESCADNVTSEHGGIFGLEFSPDGCVLLAATENRCLLFSDPLQPLWRPTTVLHSVHEDCVNCIRFLDNRLFATCSDDRTVKLWDMRFIKDGECVRTLCGHDNWVKNIEFARDKGMLITSAFDNLVLGWDINNWSSEPKRLFYTPGLMRMKLSNDGDKMIMSTQWGYIFVIHNLDLDTVAEDLYGFKANTAWISIHTRSLFPFPPEQLQRFWCDRNRVELIVDFPSECDPDHISSIAPHPQGWCVASRANDSNDRAEWSCVHDIQLPACDKTEAEEEIQEQREKVSCSGSSLGRALGNVITLQLDNLSSDDTESDNDNDQQSTPDSATDQSATQMGGSRRRRRRMRLVRRESLQSQPPARSPSPRRVSVVSGEELLDGRAIMFQSNVQRNSKKTLVILKKGKETQNDDAPSTSESQPRQCVPTHPRLLYYQREPRVGRGFIKEVSWAPDGRVLASPYAFGVRIMAFNDDCQELCDTVQYNKYTPPRQLHQVSTSIAHKNVVLSAKFSPTHQSLLATGCRGGHIVLQQPKL